MPLWLILVLAIVQGAAELLPVSSSAHVILASVLLGRDPSTPEMTFLLVMLHTGTMFAVLLAFWPRWRELVKREDLGGLKGFAQRVVVATFATGVLGLALKELIERVFMGGGSKAEIEHLFKDLRLVGGALFAVGVLIFLSGTRDKADNARPLSLPLAGLVGAIQGLCLPFRGFSRSGATISTGLLLGMPRTTCEDFSFALAVVITPPVIAKEALRLLRPHEGQPATDVMPLLAPGLIGMVLAFGSGFIALKLLHSALEKGRWRWFGVYCVVLSLVVFGVHVHRS